MTTRRDFLRTSSLIALGLLTGDDALEAMARLTHKRTLFPSGEVGGKWVDVRIRGMVYRVPLVEDGTRWRFTLPAEATQITGTHDMTITPVT